MKICLAQTEAIRGDIEANIKNHLMWINKAIELQSDLIVFPELSITGYEPKLAKHLVTAIDDDIFHPIQQVADRGKIIIAIGAPTRAVDGINISMLLFLPGQKERILYSKRLLHEDELPFFKSGKEQPNLVIHEKKIAFGICYETLQRIHITKAMKDGADIYVASVSKPDRSTDKAYIHFPSMAEEFSIPVLMVNSVGYSDNFLSNGLSSVWNADGDQIGQLNSTDQSLLIYNTETNETDSIY